MVMSPSNGRPRVATLARGAAAALLAAFVFQAEALAQAQFASSASADRAVTYSGEIADLVYQNCVVCHRPGGIGPMSLLTYEDARRYAQRIRHQVGTGLMPPYAYDRDVGIQDLKEDWRLSEEDMATVVAWVDQGAPLGNAQDVPPVPDLPDPSEWTMAKLFGPPDVIIRSTPIDVPVSGNDIWHRPIIPTGLTSDRCIMASQVKPAGNAATVVHHAIPTFQRTADDGSVERLERATEYAMGKYGEIAPEGVCRIAPANSEIRWDIHLYPGGLGTNAPGTVIEDNVVELGLWLHPENYAYDYMQDLQSYGFEEGQTEMLIPPHGKVMTQGFDVFDHPVRVDSWQPHGHLRLRAASLEVFYPETGRTETISMVSNWSAVWHQSHIYDDDSAPLIPAGAVLIQKNWYDNTTDNPNNPDPDQWINYGSRTADEMGHGWLAVTHLDEEGYQRLLAERAAQGRPAADQQE
jgi:mono/diheme cytochrome c family protein